jgi:hypothetical protein
MSENCSVTLRHPALNFPSEIFTVQLKIWASRFGGGEKDKEGKGTAREEAK